MVAPYKANEVVGRERQTGVILVTGEMYLDSQHHKFGCSSYLQTSLKIINNTKKTYLQPIVEFSGGRGMSSQV